ncbi:hypothetical protein [Streptomyces sp. enrichment culture]|uniref:hypothetical protein n=1 Tax=Streptomyces sp. enrichment culture TaxID=1795815 RepID=UPI003F578D81
MNQDREGTPVPRDMQDQEAGAGTEDRWDAAPELSEDTADDAAPDVPDTDEAGTGRRGAPHASGTHPEQPVPDEPSA